MKIFIPRDIKWGLFNMSLNIWPFTITMVQLFIVAWWVALSLGIWNSLTNQWMDKMIAFIIILPILLIFFWVAFFKFSELSLLPFLAKIAKTYFLDTTNKFQINYKKTDPLEIRIKKLKGQEKKQKIEVKDSKFDREKMKDLEWFIK